MLQLAEVFFAQAEQRRAIELRVAAYVVVGVRMKRRTILVVPSFLGVVLGFQVDGARAPVVLFARHVVAALQEQDAKAGGSQVVGQRATTRSRSNDDHVVAIVVGHGSSLHFTICV